MSRMKNGYPHTTSLTAVSVWPMLLKNCSTANKSMYSDLFCKVTTIISYTAKNRLWATMIAAKYDRIYSQSIVIINPRGASICLAQVAFAAVHSTWISMVSPLPLQGNYEFQILSIRDKRKYEILNILCVSLKIWYNFLAIINFRYIFAIKLKLTIISQAILQRRVSRKTTRVRLTGRISHL